MPNDVASKYQTLASQFELVTSDGLAGIWLPTDRGRLKAQAVLLVGQGQDSNGDQKIIPAGMNYASTSYLQRPALEVNALPVVVKSGSTLTYIQTGKAVDGSTEGGVMATCPVCRSVGPSTSTEADRPMMGYHKSVTTGAANTANTITVEPENLGRWMEIYMVCSAGTATLTVEVSMNGSTWYTVDSGAAAATRIYHYDVSHVGATLGLNPPAWKYVRITAGAAGVGNTTTINVGMIP